MSPRETGRHRQRILLGALFGLSLTAAFFFLIRGNLVPGLLALLFPFVLLYVVYLFLRPQAGLVSILAVNYFAIGLARYVPGPLGLALDGVLVLTWLSLVFSQFNRKVPWQNAARMMTLLAVVWFAYTLFQLFNPESVSRLAWFYAMRGVSLYMVLSIPLVFLLYNEPRHLAVFLRLLAWFTLAAVAKGLMQKFVGPDPWEDRWLDMGGGVTHRLPGGLRIFSFFADSATYGGSMGFSGVVFTILSLHESNRRQKFFYAGVAGAAFFALLISGTRGALAVPAAGFSMYLLLSRRFRLLLVGGTLMVSVYSVLKYTDIGGSVYEIRRIRTALDPNNPSLLVRKENRLLFKAYLADRPFGGGIGSAGNWGLRFSPGTFLAETPPDGWYIQVWAEQGIVGLSLYMALLLLILGKASYLGLFVLKTNFGRARALAFSSGMFGVMAASYSSSALGQMPNVILIYMGMAFVSLLPDWERDKRVSD
ncbi:MAG: hypothetical protein R2751_04545 [Bacteroidales bacterium]